MERGYSVEKAVDIACTECIEEDILREFLLKNRSEVMSMFLVDYKPSLQRKMDREEGREEGRTEGRVLHLISLIQKKIRKGKSLELAAEELEENVEDISEIFAVVKGNLDKNPKEILDIWNRKN